MTSFFFNRCYYRRAVLACQHFQFTSPRAQHAPGCHSLHSHNGVCIALGLVLPTSTAVLFLGQSHWERVSNVLLKAKW